MRHDNCLVANADWSVQPRKRWITIARGSTMGWTIAAPRLVGDITTLIPRLIDEAAGGAVALGIDVAVGLPRAYAATRPEADFISFLQQTTNLPDFFSVCTTLDEIRPERPFYPVRGLAGMTRLSHALALGLPNAAALWRACDRATIERPAGGPIFWTLGANQCGKATIAAWQSLIMPALRTFGRLRLWPFEGSFNALLSPGSVTLAETYPAEALRHLGICLNGSKRRLSDRRAIAGALLRAIEHQSAVPDNAMRRVIIDGFGADSCAEDRLDSVLGVLCVLNVLAGHRSDKAPADPWIQRWEGWVLGQTSPPVLAAAMASAPPAVDS